MHRLNYHLEVFNIKFLHVLIIAILVKCGGFNIFDKSRVLVNTSLGSILGYVENGIEHFLGVPFAEPPLNRYRFRHPRRKRAWYPSTYRAFNFSPECLQSALYSDNDNPTEEDCLYLNIWSPANRMELLPVLIWIYGGAFLHGGASRPYYYGHRLAAKGVVVVSFNYRVGALGFLVSSSDGVFGNSGLYDQKMAIEWVNDHISNFGGDPSRITLFGESAGAMSVALHMLNNPHNSSKCLFRSIILQSNPLGYKYRNINVANFIGDGYKQLLDCEDLQCLQAEAPDELLHVQDTMMAVPRSIGDFFTWGPVITDSSYLREYRLQKGNVPSDFIAVMQPIHAAQTLKEMNIPVLMGYNTHEGNLFVYTAFSKRLAKIVYQTLVFSFFRSAAPAVLERYGALSKQVAALPYPDYRLVLSAIIGDYLFRCPNQLFARVLSDIQPQVYLYEFSLPTKTPGFSCCDGLACHTAELPYPFNLYDVIEKIYSNENNKSLEESCELPQDDDLLTHNIIVDVTSGESRVGRRSLLSNRQVVDKRVANLMAEYWSNFAKYGDPNGYSSQNGLNGRTSSDLIWWPRLKGAVTSNDINQSESPYLAGNLNAEDYHNTKVQETAEDLSLFHNDVIDNDSLRKLSVKKKNKLMFNPMRTIDLQSLYHLMNLNSDSSVKIFCSECVCDFWNKFNYTF